MEYDDYKHLPVTDLREVLLDIYHYHHVKRMIRLEAQQRRAIYKEYGVQYRRRTNKNTGG